MFSKAIEQQTGLTFDFQSLTKLNTNFLEYSENYLVLNIKSYEDENPNNILFLTEEKSFLYARECPLPKAFEAFTKIYHKPFGKSTVLTYVLLSKVLVNYQRRFETLIKGMKEIEQTFDSKSYRELLLESERLYDRLEDLLGIIIKLQERDIKYVETTYIAFDYSILIAENNSLLNRCINRADMLRDIARDRETEATMDLNRRLERLSDIVKRLTALTVILMIPTVIASHYGMNFVYMPELDVPIAYPVVIIAQVIIVAAAIIILRRVGWL